MQVKEEEDVKKDCRSKWANTLKKERTSWKLSMGT